MKPHQLLFFALILFFVSCSKPVGKERTVKNPFYDKAWDFQYVSNKLDSAFVYYNKAKELFLKQRDSLHAGNCLIFMSIISTDEGDHYGSLETLLEARSYLNSNNKTNFVSLQAVFNTLGNTSANLKNYTQAIDFFKQSVSYTKNIDTINIVNNNLANAYRENRNYEKSLILYQQILALDIHKKIYPQVLTNMSIAKWLQDSSYNAAPELLKALHIREKQQDNWGKNSSFSHLADYYTKSHPDSALLYAEKMYQIAKQLNSPDDELDALKKLVKLSSLTKTKLYFESYRQLDDSLQTARSAAKNQFALIRYETEKNKTNFLQAQAENIKKNIWLGILVVCLIVGYFWYRRRQKILKQEKELEVKNTEIKYVKRIHDRVANKVYQVMSEVENSPEMDKNDLADKLDVIYQISRDLSYENKDIHEQETFAQELLVMLNSYSSTTVEVTISGNDQKLWEHVVASTRSELFYILQELMTNMKKHSKADKVQLIFQQKDQHIEILYADNGKGMKDSIAKNGLKNTETRIKSIVGRITFDSKPDHGLEVQISFPIL